MVLATVLVWGTFECMTRPRRASSSDPASSLAPQSQAACSASFIARAVLRCSPDGVRFLSACPSAGLASLPHGGELLGPEHVRDVVAALGPTRLGHGVRTSEDPALLDSVVAAGISLEVCPASNVCLGVYRTPEDVPLVVLLEHGAQVALGADDPLLFQSRLIDQYEIARRLGLDDVALAELARGSIRACLASPASKRQWLAEVDVWLAG